MDRSPSPPTARVDAAKLIQPLRQLPHNLSPYSSAKGDHEYESGFPRAPVELTGIQQDPVAMESGKIIQPLGQLGHNIYPTSYRGDHLYECPSPRQPMNSKPFPAGIESHKTSIDGKNVRMTNALGMCRTATGTHYTAGASGGVAGDGKFQTPPVWQQ